MVRVTRGREAMIEVAGYTGGREVPTARFRFRQFAEPLRGHGVLLREYFPSGTCYPPPGAGRRLRWGARIVAERLRQVLAGRHADAVLFQRELISTIPSFEWLAGRPRILDLDDATWLHQRFRAVDRLLASVDLAICGNDYLAEHASAFCDRVEVLPTGLDTDYWSPGVNARPAGAPVLAWSGSSSGLVYLESIEPALREVLAREPAARLRVVSDRPPRLPGLDPARVDFVPWSPATEVDALRDATVGLMPLTADPWARGKCGFKLLSYMAVGLPAVASPVGPNTAMVQRSSGGFTARLPDEWVDALVTLLADEALRARMGAAGRMFVERHYSVRVLAPRLAGLLHGVVR